jgi:hypothetical protein
VQFHVVLRSGLLVPGTGKRLFRQTPHAMGMRLLDCTPTTTGVLLLGYEPVRGRGWPDSRGDRNDRALR